MECIQNSFPDSREYMRQFNKKITRLRVPLTGSIDLTGRCNLRCIHCYLGDYDLRPNRAQEMSTGRLMSVIDEISEAGCLNLLITGGEPFMREDFKDTYRHIKERGIIPTVFTNGTLLTDDILQLFSEFPPQAVEISLYGATPETYEKITGVPGSYEKCMSGIRRLIENKTRVKLKTILMTLNRHEFFDIENIARGLGLSFRFDAGLFPCLNGDKAPMDLRVSPEEAVEKEFSDPKRVQGWLDYSRRYSGLLYPETLYTCGAGVTSFHIDSYGNLKPCLLSTDLSYDLKPGDFLAAWNEVVQRMLEKRPGPSFTCNGCEKWTFCNFCPAFFGLENKAEDVRSDYLCSIGEKRFQKICYNKTIKER